MISGFFVPSVMAQPLVMVTLRIPSIRPEWVPVPFVIDTGAASTCLHALDSMGKFGMTAAALNPVAWVDTKNISGIGGEVQYIDRPAQFAFEHEDGEWQVIDASIRIGSARTQALPSLLGCDVLQFFELRVLIGAQKATLERQRLS